MTVVDDMCHMADGIYHMMDDMSDCEWHISDDG